MMLLTDSPSWRWQWTTLCGADGLKIWSLERRDLGLCFQQLCLQIPVLAVLACSSAYYFGRQTGRVTRGPLQRHAINLRCLIVFAMAVMPLLQIYINININSSNNHILYISFFLCAVQVIAYFAHFWYTIVLRKRLSVSPRGPVVVCVVWTLLFVLTVISLRSYILSYYLYDPIKPNYNSVYLALVFSICHLVLQILYALTLIPNEGGAHYIYLENWHTRIGENEPLLLNNPYIRFSEPGDPNYLGVAMEGTSWLSKLLFCWVSPLMNKGIENNLQSCEDLYDLPVSLASGTIGIKLEKALIANVDTIKIQQQQLTAAGASSSTGLLSDDVTFSSSPLMNNTSLLRALHHCFWLQFYSIGILKFSADCAGFAGPILLKKLIGFIENKSEDIQWGYLYATGLMTTTLISAFCDSHFNFHMSIVGLKMRSALVTTIYRKTLTVSSTALNSAFSSGEIINFMSTDTDRIVNSCPSFHAIWSIPFQLIITLYLLYSQVGVAFLAGVIFTIILLPINKVIANKIAKLSTKLMKEKDARVKMITEVLRGNKAIKLYVWEQHFIRLITKVRDNELKYLKGRKYLDAICVYFWATTPVLISIFTFGTYVLMGNQLTAATVFTGMTLLNMLISPLNAFPWVLNGLTEAWVSIQRIQKLLNLKNIDLNQFYITNSNNDFNDQITDIEINNATFNWGKELSNEDKLRLHCRQVELINKISIKGKGKGKVSTIIEENEQQPYVFNLKQIDVKIKRGEFVGIIGNVGSGKSTLLSAILAELPRQQGTILVSNSDTGFGLVTQQPWLQRGTVRDNILFGKAYNESKYNRVLFACALAEDIHSLPAGDLTGVGDSGQTLSGGQKARIALARAVYQNDDVSIYLLDDILSAVDVHVAKHIFKHCLMGLLKNKTRILITHLVQYLVKADQIWLMDNGRIIQKGKPIDVLPNVDDFSPIDLELLDEESVPTTISSSSLSTVDNTALSNRGIVRSGEKTTDNNDSVLEQEVSETGSLKLSVFASYWKAIGHFVSISILVSIIMMQISRNMTDWWLSHWVSNAQTTNNTNLTSSSFYESITDNDIDNNTGYYMRIYIELVCFNSLFTMIRAFLFAYGGIMAATKIHRVLLKTIVNARSKFFDVIPLGRILNRFSSDTYTIDDSLPFILNILLSQFFGLLGTIIITIYGLPWVCLILLPLIPVYHSLQHYYRLTSRSLKRISCVSLSPIYSHFNESLEGLTTIRAMRTAQRFKHDNEDYVDANIKAQFAGQAAARWLGLRLQFIAVAMVAGVSFITIIQHQYDMVDPGLVGLALSYALTVTSSLSGVINAFTETERELVSVERVNEYMTDSIIEYNHFIMDPPFGWPNQGVISFKDVLLKYRANLALSLRNISFETRPSEKIGVCGRTGAGKSSLITAIFRLVELNGGVITIDSVDVSKISLQCLRSRIFCIPQEPFLFSGSLRENLDPLGEFREHEIWSALAKVNLCEFVNKLGGLDNFVMMGGGLNFSLGQKQLICLARAVLHNAKILCIDEATANIDQDTDRQIQLILRSAFRKSTVITIAHRVQTILDSDRVLVMNDGEIVEFDSPHNLLAETSSYFYQLVNQQEG